METNVRANNRSSRRESGPASVVYLLAKTNWVRRSMHFCPQMWRSSVENTESEPARWRHEVHSSRKSRETLLWAAGGRITKIPLLCGRCVASVCMEAVSSNCAWAGSVSPLRIANGFVKEHS
mmetsp:Transcript_50155/g.144530  ORF Transcript_50155/g.144530 Transcript_50155/m.144530 type:complete len:122 (-) Transcript_50155:454-819(-)